MRLLRIGMLWLALVNLVSLSARAAELRELRVAADPQGTRVVLELSANTRHSVFALKNPDRVVIDVADVKLSRAAHRPPAGGGVVKQVRLGRRPSGGLRVVLDLTQSTRARSFASATRRSGYRLEIDLGSASRSAEARPQVAAAITTEVPVESQPSDGPDTSIGATTSTKTIAAIRAEAAVDSGAAVKAGAAAQTEAGAPMRGEHARPEARDLIIAIDAGHGGEDPGAIGKLGTREKDVTLAIARDLAMDVNQEPGMHAVLTRNGDYFVPLRDRMRRARAQQADLFVSIHADSIRDRSVDGSSVYILSQRGATSEAARWLAERENAADLIGGVKLEDKGNLLASVLLDLSQSASLSASHTAAEHVLHQLNLVGEVRRPLVQQAGFMVLKSPDIPSMLVETAYISNPLEEQKLRALLHQAKIADAIHRGIRAYFYADPPAGTRVAQLAAGTVVPALAPNTVRDSGG